MLCVIYAIIQLKSHQRELGSSLPVMGGGGTMKKFRKIEVLILILKLVVQLIELFK